MKNITLGYDPEFFLEIEETDELYPSIGLFGGTKEKKQPLVELGEGFGIEEDNVAVELTCQPAKNKMEFVDNMEIMLNYLENTLIPNISIKNKVPDLKLSKKSSGEFLFKYLNNAQAQSFGCSPELCAYSLNMSTVDASEAGNFRSCGGHIHIGYENPTVEKSSTIARALDLYLGLPSLVMDSDKNRRKLYGKAGSMRETPYGVEYRTLSNFWTFTSEKVAWVYDQIQKALENLNLVEDSYSELCMEVQNTINENEIESAKILMNMYNIIPLLEKTYIF
jgi:hypothetical protein